MRVRLRFVVTLTLVVSAILAISFFIIYTLYAQNRKKDFDNRLWAHAYNTYRNQYRINDTDKEVMSKLTYYLPGSPTEFSSVIIDSSYHLVASNPRDFKYTIDTNLLFNIKDSKELYFLNGDSQSVGLYFNQYDHECFVIATGYDKFGLARLHSLKLTMIYVSIGSIILLCIFTFLYVMIVTRPLITLSIQMRKVSENNLKQRVSVGKGDARHNEIVRIAKNFNGMLDRLERAFTMQKNFVHHASHDLRTPLATMLSQTESALRRELAPQEAKKVLESLKEDQQGMIELTNALLLLSQYENINYTAGWPEVRLDEVMYDSIASMQKMFPGITINFDFSADDVNESYLYLKGNEVLLRSAFVNLLKNGIKYSDDSKVDITMQPEAGKVIIHFENRGPVMQPDEVERMFFPFFRGENAQQKKGFGLGLSIVKRITELHSCQVTYKVINGNINCFILTFFRSQ
ncbi:HAMP domain-containing histidine kinase [Panacibacter ginsenosidivorans]|uniref:histidine kinase n=1 Tax=Panacibacter ginsenosidivorans TaxID=1813871 RepID=A0A5B8VDB5_9BACT|nr:HAMP domain-containing sensor histidine kinase [Panacibacter ginsenosidivorans]QEC69527.1 HAMP domain-containing histidine kinase [Panacibacter ginsenosidivorans]